MASIIGLNVRVISRTMPNSILYRISSAAFILQDLARISRRISSNSLFYSKRNVFTKLIHPNNTAIQECSAGSVSCAGFQTDRCFSSLRKYLKFQSVVSQNNKLYCTNEKKPSIVQEVVKSKLPPTLTPPQPTPSPGIDGKEESKGTDKKESWFSGKNAWKFGLVSLSAVGVLMGVNLLILWGRPIRDPEGNDILDEYSDLPIWEAYPKRAMKEMHIFKKMIQEPSSPKLLPDVLKEPWYQPPYTLVLELTGVLVHPDWTLGTGWRFKKRPGLDYFLQQVGPPMFEVVVYTHEQGFTAFPLIDGLDPNGFIMFRLFRDATRYVNGAHVKDLDCLNRDLSKVIIIDCDPKAFSLQPQNAFLLRKWNGDDTDRTLVDLAAFLRTVAMSEVEDVRTVLEYYSQFDDPLTVFKEKQKLLQEQQEGQARVAAGQKNQKSLVGNWSFGLTGLKRS